MRPVTFRIAAAIALLTAVAPSVSLAQSAPPSTPAPLVAPGPRPQAGWQVPVPEQVQSAQPPYGVQPAHANALPGSAYIAPSLAATTGAQPFFPPRKEIRSVGSIIGGSVLATVGAFPLVGGLVITAHGTDQGIDYAAVGGPMAAIGALMVGGGVALIVWGSGEEWVRCEEVAAIPTVRVGATSASAQWVF